MKQDRQGVRTPAQLEQKYQFGKTFAEVMGIATDALDTAEEAKENVENLDNSLTPEEIFNRLTNNGEVQGIYRDENGQIYVNASYIRTGIIKSTNGLTFFDLNNSKIQSSTPCKILDDKGETVDGTLFCSMESGMIRFYVEETDGLWMDRLRIEVNPTAPLEGDTPGCTIRDGYGESDFPRGIGIVPYGNLILRSENKDTIVGNDGGFNPSNTYIQGDSILLVASSGYIDMDDNRLAHVADPVNETDAANKRYVDSKAAGVDTVVSVVSGAEIPFSLEEGEKASITYVPENNSYADVTMLVNATRRSTGYVQAATTSFSTESFLMVATNNDSFFSGELRVVGGRVYLTGIGLRGNGSGPGTIAMIWNSITAIETLTFNKAGTLAYRKV